MNINTVGMPFLARKAMNQVGERATHFLDHVSARADALRERLDSRTTASTGTTGTPASPTGARFDLTA